MTGGETVTGGRAVLVAPRRLRRLMTRQGVTQRELAAHAGWRSHTYVGRLLRGDADTVTADAAGRIAARLDVPTDSLFDLPTSRGQGVCGRWTA